MIKLGAHNVSFPVSRQLIGNVWLSPSHFTASPAETGDGQHTGACCAVQWLHSLHNHDSANEAVRVAVFVVQAD